MVPISDYLLNFNEFSYYKLKFWLAKNDHLRLRTRDIRTLIEYWYTLQAFNYGIKKYDPFNFKYIVNYDYEYFDRIISLICDLDMDFLPDIDLINDDEVNDFIIHNNKVIDDLNALEEIANKNLINLLHNQSTSYNRVKISIYEVILLTDKFKVPLKFVDQDNNQNTFTINISNLNSSLGLQDHLFDFIKKQKNRKDKVNF